MSSVAVEQMDRAAVTSSFSVHAQQQLAFTDWQSVFTRAAAQAAGFLSVEIVPAFVGSLNWRVTQRFESGAMLERWRQSPARAALFAGLAAICATAADHDGELDFHAMSCVTEVITTMVEPGREDAFQEWSKAIQAAQARFPGYMGTLIQAPLPSASPHWTALVRFSTPAELDRWLGSPERQALLDGSDPLVSRWRSRRLASPFEGWFPPAADQAPQAAWKQTCLVLLVLFPVVMLEIRFLSPLLAGQHLAVATFIGNAISVSLVSWPLMKLAVAGLGWWLRPEPAHRVRTEALGLCTMAGLYGAELLTFILLY